MAVVWILAGSLPGAAAGAVAYPLGRGTSEWLDGLVGTGPLSAMLSLASVGAAVGTLVGLCQWLVLRPHVPAAFRWVPATIVGALVGWPAAFAAAGLLISILPAGLWTVLGAAGRGAAMGGVGLAVLGASAGLAQAAALRPHGPRAGRWVLASTLGGAVAGALGGGLLLAFVAAPSASIAGILWDSLRRPLGETMAWNAFVAAMFGFVWLVSGAVTGGVMSRWLTR